MARVTVEDCVKVVESRFELILIAAERSRILSKGAEPLLDRDRDKNPVVALREIAEEKLDLEQTKETLVKGLQKYHEEVLTEPDEDEEAENMEGLSFAEAKKGLSVRFGVPVDDIEIIIKG